MSAALYLVINSDAPGFDTAVNGKALSRSSEQLEAAAKELGVTPLMAFFSMSAEELDASVEEFGISEEAAAKMAPEQWFDPDEGLRTVRALLPAFEADAKARADLLAFVSVFEEAAKRGLRFHLAVDY